MGLGANAVLVRCGQPQRGLRAVAVLNVRAFGFTWQDCENPLDRLDCRTRVEVFA